MPKSRVKRVRRAFDREDLRRVCEMHEGDFADTYEMVTVHVAQSAPADSYYFRDNGSDVLAVAHLDTVALHHQRTCHFLDTEGGPVVYSRALDDRLGAYIILELLPALGITYDVLLTVGEEDSRSTAAFFEPPKDYDWMIEFDRGGTDVVMYQYEDDATCDLVRASGAVVGDGIFSDISYMDHLGIKGFNWGVGYRDYHSPRSHAYLDDTFSMVAKYLRFHDANAGTILPHDPGEHSYWSGYGQSRFGKWSWLDSLDDDACTTEFEDDKDYSEYPTREELEAVLQHDVQ